MPTGRNLSLRNIQCAALRVSPRAVRRLRNENRVQERVAVDARVKTADPAPLLEEEALLRRLARLGALQVAPDVERPAACGVEVLAIAQAHRQCVFLVGRQHRQLECGADVGVHVAGRQCGHCKAFAHHMSVLLSRFLS